MAIQYWWWVIGLGLGILEMLSGTFVLLMLGVGSAAAGAVAALGGPLWLQFVTAACVSLAGVVAVRRMRAARPAAPSAACNPDVVADVGERVQVSAWGEDGMTQVRYRGAQWTAELAPGEVATAGEYRIREVTGNRLVLARR